MITRRGLVRALERSPIAEWAVFEREQEIAVVDAANDLRRRETRTHWTVIAHHDATRGRGSARVDVASSYGEPLDVVAQALALTNAAIGPAWKGAPLAAPAKVELADPKLEADLETAAARIARGLRSAGGARLSPRIQVLRETVVVQSQSGFTTRWTASELQAVALVTRGTHSVQLARRTRAELGLQLIPDVSNAVADLDAVATAGAATPGPCAIVLGPGAMLHDDDRGVWSVFAAQADSVLERQGLTRYRIGMPIVEGADMIDDPLTITSDGALPFGLRSAPVGEDGDAVRRFRMIDRGVAAGLGLSPREAALRRRDPNGGVRNLVVAPGTWDGLLPAVGARGPLPRTIELRRLRGISIDPYTGDASLEIALGFEYRDAKPRAFTGGTVRLDLIAALARARRSASTIQRGAYSGPSSVLIEDAELVA